MKEYDRTPAFIRVVAGNRAVDSVQRTGEVETMNNPYWLRAVPTSFLVRELCSREGVVEYDFSSGEFYSLKSGNYREKQLGLLEMKDGPVKIIVVPGGE